MPAADYVLVEVRDTGTGIPESILGKIFDPFFSTKEVGKGTGLGLSTVYGIIKQTGGFVYVDSAVHEGTTFRIFLPRHVPGAAELAEQAAEIEAPAITQTLVAADQVRRAAGVAAPAKAPASADLTGEGTILLVEDEEGLRALNARGLASRGYTVLEAGNGVEAIDVLEKSGKPVDLVVSDVVMPEMDGPTLARELRSRNPGPEDHFRLRLCGRCLPEESARARAVRLPAEAVHAQAARRRGEGDAGGVNFALPQGDRVLPIPPGRRDRIAERQVNRGARSARRISSRRQAKPEPSPRRRQQEAASFDDRRRTRLSA